MEIFVGPAETKFIVHKSILIEKSDFFKSWFTGLHKIGDDVRNPPDGLRLPQESVGLFEAFVHFLYTGSHDVSLVDEHGVVSEGAFVEMLFLYKQAQEMDCPDAQRALI